MDTCRIPVGDDGPDPGQLALQRLNDNGGDPVDTVLTGIDMPEMDGLTLLKQIRPFVKFIPWTQDSRWSPFAIPEAH